MRSSTRRRAKSKLGRWMYKMGKMRRTNKGIDVGHTMTRISGAKPRRARDDRRRSLADI